MAINTLPVVFQRNYKGSPFVDGVFTSTLDLNNWLTSPTRYAGQIATLVEAGVVTVYKLNAAEDTWEEIGSGGASGASEWITATAYVIGNQIYNPLTKKLYICTVDHTSSADFNTDIANWGELSSGGFPDWVTATAYLINDKVYDAVSGSLYVCSTAHTSGVDFITDIANWTAIATDLTAGVTGVLPVANGGTNSSTALVNSKVMVSSGDAIVEAANLSYDGSTLTASGNSATPLVSLGQTGSGTTLEITNGGSGDFVVVNTDKLVVDNAGNTSLGGDLTVTGVTKASNGTEALPSITNTADTNTGIHFPTADSLAVSTGGTTKLLIDNNVKVTDNDGTSVLRSESEVLYIEDFKENDHTIFTGVSGTITLSSNTTSPIGKYRSLKADIVSGLANDSFTSPVIAVTDYMKSFGAVGFFSNTKFNGNIGDMQYLVEFNNGTDWTTIPSQRFDIRNGDKLNKFLFQFDSTCVSFRYTPIITAAGNYVLEIGMVRLVSNPMPTAESVESVEYTLLQASGSMTNATNELEFNLGTATITNQINRFIEAVDDSANTRTKFIALRNVKISGSFASSAASNRGLAVTKNGVIYHAGNTTSGAGDYVDVDIEMELNAGEYFTVASMDTSRAISATAITGTADLTFTATATSSNVVFEGAASDFEEKSYTSTISGWTISSQNLLYRKTFGDRIGIDGLFTVSGAAASLAYMTTPSGFTTKTMGTTSADRRIVGTYTRNLTTNTHGGWIIAGGDLDGDKLYFSSSGVFGSDNISSMSLSNANSIQSSGDILVNILLPVNELKASDLIYSVPVTNEVENVYSARIPVSGTVLTSESSKFIKSIAWTGGQCTIVWVDGFFTVAPSVTATIDVAGSTRYASAALLSTTGVSIDTNVNGAASPLAFSIQVQRQGADYKAPKGYFLGNMARVNHLLGGVEYETGELWAGQKVYARSYEFTGLTVNTVIDNIPSINVISITGTANHPTYGTDYITGLNITDNGSGTGVVWSRYRISTGDFEIVLSGVTVQGTATIKYTR